MIEMMAPVLHNYLYTLYLQLIQLTLGGIGCCKEVTKFDGSVDGATATDLLSKPSLYC